MTSIIIICSWKEGIRHHFSDELLNLYFQRIKFQSISITSSKKEIIKCLFLLFTSNNAYNLGLTSVYVILCFTSIEVMQWFDWHTYYDPLMIVYRIRFLAFIFCSIYLFTFITFLCHIIIIAVFHFLSYNHVLHRYYIVSCVIFIEVLPFCCVLFSPKAQLKRK